MDSIELLWQLQNHSNTLKEIKNNLEKVINGNKIENIGKELKETENKLMDLEKRIEVNENKLNKNNSILKEYDFQLKEIEKDLYQGNITDLKQLGFLDKEREAIRKEIDEKELEILLQMEHMEELKIEFIEIEEDFKNLRKEYTKLIKEYKFLIEEYKNKAKESKKEMDEISLKIDGDILRRYIQIKNNKGTAIAEVIDHKCNGCNMLLPTFILDKLKDDDSIIYCESCGRILYVKK